MTEPEALDLASLDITAEKRAQLLRLFPEARTEGGKIDFERLRLALGETVDVGKERYGLTWAGKSECFRAIQTPSMGTLRPVPEESVNFDTSENMIIEGDNLEVLKLLQKSYFGRVKMIYIDPPYNTGNDFVYPDNYSESLQTYLAYTGQKDASGYKFGTNTDADGRFHSKWLNMMYPRLYLARNLLRDDGVIFISVDDHEVHALKMIMNELFGESSFVAQIAVVNNLKGRNDREHIATVHEYLLMYANDEFESQGLPLSDKQIAEYRQQSDDGMAFQWRDLRRRGGADTRLERPKLYFPIYANPQTGAVSIQELEGFSVRIVPQKSNGVDGRWRWGLSTVANNISDIRASKVDGKDKWNVNYRVYLEKDGEIRSSKPKSTWMGPEFSTDVGTKTLRSLIHDVQELLTPKPVELILSLSRISLEKEDLVLDFFAGSGTTAHAVLDLNKQDGGNRKFILVQLPEPTNRTDYPTIADITKERVRRVIKKLDEADAAQLALGDTPKQDRGFRVFKLAESNLTSWNTRSPGGEEKLEQQLELHIRHLRSGRTDLDLLYEILLKCGFPLTAPMSEVTLAGKQVFSIAEGEMLICLERAMTLELIRAIAELAPTRVICLDEAFAGNDQLKANAVWTFKAKAEALQREALIFQTV